MSKKRDSSGCDVNMTPMIDVVFQLIIFFVVTLNMAEAKDETVRLELAAHGGDAKEAKANAAGTTTSAYIIDVNQKGDISVSGMRVTPENIRQTLRRRLKRQGGTFEVWIRGDGMAKHEDISKVMDVCSEEGIGRVTFLAIQGDEGVRTDPQKAYLTNPKMSDRQYVATHPGKQPFRSVESKKRYAARTHWYDPKDANWMRKKK